MVDNLNIGELNSWIEGSSSNINSIENEMRKYCVSNNIEMVHLYSKKATWFRKTCYFHLKGDLYELQTIKYNLQSLLTT